jgi:predicted alpha/beta superfamily hydrolase
MALDRLARRVFTGARCLGTAALLPTLVLARDSHQGGGTAPGPGSATVQHTVVGKLDVHTSFISKELGTRRALYVLLPPHYESDPQRRFPVVYAQNGQDLFDAATAAGGEEWAIDELLQAEPPGIAEMIVVGITAAPQAMAEFAPPGSRDDARGDAYVRFLVSEVKPFIDAHYRTQPGPARAVLLGEGAGGILALYGAWSEPKVFGAAIALGLPDLDARGSAWAQVPPKDGAPRLWIEQESSDMARISTTTLLAALKRAADVQLVMAGPRSSRLTRLAAGLRALLPQ